MVATYDQKELISRLLDLGLYRKLASCIQLRDMSQSRFLFTEKGSLKMEIEQRLRVQLSDRIGVIL